MSGMNGFMTKPVSNQELVNLLILVGLKGNESTKEMLAETT